MLDEKVYCPLISQLSLADQKIWVKQLNIYFSSADSDYLVEVVLDIDLTIEQKKRCEFAIVANPEPSEFSAYPNLKWVQSLWAGVEKLLTDLASYSFLIVRLVDPMLSQIMSEAVLAWSLYLHRQMPAYIAQQKSGCWKQLPHVLPQERTICVLGLGQLGRESALSLKQHGFNVTGWSQSEKFLNGVQCFYGETGLHKAMIEADIVVCLLPLTAKTHHLVNKTLFTQMKKGASLINFARGGIVNYDDLIDMLDNGHLTHAVLDVFDVEPLTSESSLWQHDKLTILPHISAPTHVASATEIVVSNINHYLNSGDIPKSIDKAKGY